MMKRALFPLAALCTSLCTSLGAQAPTPAPKAQTPPDQKAYNAARALADPEQKLAALRQFIQDYPDSSRKGAAHTSIFGVLVDSFPQRTAEIDEEAKLQIKGDKDYQKWSAEARTARRMAAAEPAGADLPLARKFADDALKNENEAKVTKAYLGYFGKGEKAPKPAEIQAFYKSARASALGASAYVAYREGNLTAAKAQADEAFALAPRSADVNTLRANLAYSQHRDADALESLERAQVAGSLTKRERGLLLKLYAAGSPTGDLQATLDAKYREMFPEPFEPAAHTPASGGHTALLELYTGSGCPPCVGGDLAVEGLLASHPRTELVALAYDLHIPRPDPLTSPDTVARAAWYKVNSTPSYVLDGMKLGAFGGDREDAEGLYEKLLKQVDEQAAKPGAVQLALTTTPGAAGIVNAQAVVTLGDAAALAQPSLPVLPVDATAKRPTIAPATPAAVAPRYTLNFALVEDDVRYSGENGVRFHRMVVRALAKPSEKGFPLEAGKSVTLDAVFDPAVIAAASRDYLDTFEKTNDRFGPMEFLSKDTTEQPQHLAIAAWVQDVETHRVLQAAFLPVGAADGVAGGTR